MAFWTYMLRCADGRYYTGHTDNLEHRIAQHQCGQGSQFTRNRLPVELVWTESFASRIEALEAENIVGGWSRAKKEALIAGDWRSVGHFARPPHERQQPFPFVSSEVEKREDVARRFSTSLETNGAMDIPPPEGRGFRAAQ